MERVKILIVEDEHTIAKCMQLILSQEGYDVSDVVATGEEAVDIACKTRPDLVLMDIKLRGKIDGITACERIRKATDTPVVFVSAYADTETIARANANTPSGYITKPFKTKRLLGMVKTALAEDSSSPKGEGA